MWVWIDLKTYCRICHDYGRPVTNEARHRWSYSKRPYHCRRETTVMRGADGMIIQKILKHLSLFDDFESLIPKSVWRKSSETPMEWLTKTTLLWNTHIFWNQTIQQVKISFVCICCVVAYMRDSDPGYAIRKHLYSISKSLEFVVLHHCCGIKQIFKSNVRSKILIRMYQAHQGLIKQFVFAAITVHSSAEGIAFVFL